MDQHICNLITSAVENYDCNYFEFNILNTADAQSLHEDVFLLETSLARDKFYRIMQTISTDDMKFYQKAYKESIIGNTVYHNSKNEEISIFNVETKMMNTLSKNVCLFGKAKNKLTILSLPSTNHIHYESYVKRLTLKITNRIFVNFEHGLSGSERFYRIYMNYNHDKDVDMSSVAITIEKTLKKLEVA